MKQEVQVTFYLKRSETKEDGKCPVMARLRVDQSPQIVFSTRLRVQASVWASGTREREKPCGHIPVVLRQAVWGEYKWWWFWKRVKTEHLTISSDNPHVEVKHSEYIHIYSDFIYSKKSNEIIYLSEI